MKSGLGILVLHYGINRVVLNNLASIRNQNPRATIVTISAGAVLPGGYSLEATPELKKIHAAHPSRSSDWLMCSWFLQRRESCQKWWVVEWDTFCRLPVRSFYGPVWDLPFVATTIQLPRRDHWFWFRHVPRMPPDVRSYAMGAAPFLYLLSERAVKLICSALIKNPFSAGNGELRFATIANKCGVPPHAYSPPHSHVTFHTAPFPMQLKTVFHPVKHLVQDPAAAGRSG
jgi:hypothetical protein